MSCNDIQEPSDKYSLKGFSWPEVYPEAIKVFILIFRDFGSAPEFDLKYMYFWSSFEIQVIIKSEQNNTEPHCCNISKYSEN